MRRIVRHELSAQARRMLDGRTKKVAEAGDPTATAKQLWSNKNSASWGHIRRVLMTMSTGSSRCMYCEDSSGTDIEHFYPKSTYPEFTYDWDNYLLACTTCNSNYKRDQFPLDGDRELLINPTWEDPAEYLELSPTTGKWTAKGGCREGRESVRVFGLARFDQLRADAWCVFQEALRTYGRLHARGDLDGARAVRERLRRKPFSGVLVALFRFAVDPNACKYIDKDVLDILAEHPELLDLFY